MNKNLQTENDLTQLKEQLEEARAEAAYYKNLARQAGIQRLKDIDHLSSVINRIRKTDKALKDNRDLLSAILEFSPAILHIKDLEGKYTLVNRRYEELLNLDGKRIIGKHPSDLFPKETADAFAESEKTVIRSGEGIEVEETLEVNGKPYTMLSVKFPLLDPAGRVSSVCTISTDITERKFMEEEKARLETELRQAHKMEAMGTLAGGIAHDFNNILSGIFGDAQLAQLHLKDPAKAKEDIEAILNGAQRAADLVQQILTFSRRTENEKQLLNISTVVKESLKLLRSSIPSTIEVESTVASNTIAMADPTQIHQVIINLCTNAYQAMRKTGGTLTVGLEKVEVRKKNEVPGLRIKPGDYAVLTVSDTGCGMDGETVQKAFDPYFTTKEPGEGTGLGLALVKGIVEEHGGYIKTESRKENGSTFRIYLPGAEPCDGDSLAENKGKKPVCEGNECIMVVDDEESILFSTRELLKDSGYKVETYSEGLQALKDFEAAPDRYDLVITDMTMPGITGDALIKEILTIRPQMPVILCSGYADNLSEDKTETLGISTFIQKPILNEDLTVTVRRILDRCPE